MIYYFTNEKANYRLEISAYHLDAKRDLENTRFKYSINSLASNTSQFKEGSFTLRKVGEDFFYTLDQKLWQRLPKKYSSKEIFGDQALKIFDGFLPSGASGTKGGDGSIQSQMPGKISKISVKVGDEVKEGQSLLIMEAMKMENEVKSPLAGIVEKIFVTSNQNVDSNAPLIFVKKLP
ncbi:MAG: acetyl-CoA carboxylase biotin carboxyl carrier protein subunit [Bacteriovoracaceae bacterium]|nr:acetyl-CoA carboxylase biotin carboxyl carrier protein subunit [Bacteriovoracaceae bacterium]